MKRFLVALSLGPVQSLIGAARSTRDLWCGSWLLSEAARAAARTLHERQPGCLIFPHVENPDADLEPRDAPADAANIANVIRAEIAAPDSAAVRALCQEAKAAAASRLKALGDSARREMERLRRPVREEVWQAQIDDILQGFAAWAPLDTDDGYAAASDRLGVALAARKATRDFRACRPLAAEGLPKSSLDGARETVLPKMPQGDRGRRKLRLSDGEQLDALGVMKRLVGDSEQFTAWPRIAADPWIQSLAPERRERLCAAYEPLVELELATRTRGNGGLYEALPFDASLLFRFRLENALSRASDEREKRRLSDLRRCLVRIAEEKAGDPVPYAAVLKADGDRMGALLSKADSADRARDISSALRGFASEARALVRAHRGHAVYAGGDDVLAFLPLAQAQQCARALADAFAESLRAAAAALGLPESERPTLSAGLGIGHVMEPMTALRARAEKAERAAKGDSADAPRNALAIVLGVRSGAELCWRARWSDTGAFDALERMTGAFGCGVLPARVAYDLRGIDRRLAWLRDDDGDRARGMRRAEVRRLLERARIRGGAQGIPGDLQETIVERAGAQPLRELADTLIVARWLAARSAGDLGERA